MTWALMGGKALEFLKNIPTWVYIALAFLVTLQIVDMRAEGRGRKKAQQKAADDTRKTIDKIEEKSDDRIQRAEEIRAANPVSEFDDSMSDQPLSGAHYRD